MDFFTNKIAESSKTCITLRTAATSSNLQAILSAAILAAVFGANGKGIKGAASEIVEAKYRLANLSLEKFLKEMEPFSGCRIFLKFVLEEVVKISSGWKETQK